MSLAAIIEDASLIAGPVDMSSNGRTGVIEVTGEFADALIDALNLVPRFTDQFRGKPVRISRQASLELWCNGWYMEGTGVRRIVDKAVRALLDRPESSG